MSSGSKIWKSEESAVFALRSLYQQYGYIPYKMNKFEEYDFYAENKDFLVSENIITFTDTNGKLMALKPDVTLSIIKNSKDLPLCVQKVCYNENVYRVSRGSRSFKEIMQAGLECLGDVDDYCLGETLMLAARSLRSISGESLLVISHLGLLWSALEAAGLSARGRQEALECIAGKNLHELAAVCEREGADGADRERLRSLAQLHGAPPEVLEALAALLGESLELAQLRGLMASLAAEGLEDMLRIDFSVTSNIRYYNGIVFKGFIRGLPEAVLSGGQYDRLMRRLGRRSGAVGFAVYLDMLERLERREQEYDVDTVLLYDATVETEAVHSAVRRLTAGGRSVAALRSVPEKLRYRELIRLGEKEEKRGEERA